MSASRRELFTRPFRAPEPEDRYARQLVFEGWGEAAQRRVTDASVLVIGAGALGSPVASYLAGAGVGRIGIADGDDVELTNLHRQHLHYTPDVGSPKALSAVTKLQLLNPDVQIEPYRVRLDADNAEGLTLGHDLVVDCTDAFTSRYLINAACCENGVDLVEGGVLGLSGLVMAIRPGESACYRCAFPEPAGACDVQGVLGPVPGVVGSLMALEALKLLGGLEGALLDAFLQIDLATGDFLRVSTSRREDCPDCA